MNLKTAIAAVCTLSGTIMITGCASIQAVIDRETACGNDPKAEAAAARLTDEIDLKKVITTGQNNKARIVAIKKSNDVQTFAQLTCSGDESVDVRSAAFQRLVELGVVDNYISSDPNFAAIVLTGGGYSREESMQRDGYAVATSSSGQAMQFPIEYRLKAIAPVKAEWTVSRNLKTVALDDSAPIEVRTAAAQNVDFDGNEFKVLLRRAGDDNNPARAANEQLVKAYLATVDLRNNHSVEDAMCDGSVPLSSRKMAFSSIKIKKNEDKEFVRFFISKTVGDYVLGQDLKKNPNSHIVQFAKYVIANAPQEALASSLGDSVWKGSPLLDEALDKITSEDLLAGIAKESNARIALGAARRMKDPDPAKRLIADIAEAKHNSDATERGAAICRVYAASPREAYSIVRFDNDIIISIPDKKVVLGLLEVSKRKGMDWPMDDKARAQLMKAIYVVSQKQMNGLPKEKIGELAAQAQARAKSLASGGKTLVIGNYYARMPLTDFIVLNKVQDVKATALLWEQKAQSEEFSVVSFALDTKSLYKATGLEKSQLRFGLPRKLGIAEFEVETTDVKYERNYLAEAMNIYGAGKVTGGDLYFKSESQAKGVTVTLWDKTGCLKISAIQ